VLPLAVATCWLLVLLRSGALSVTTTVDWTTGLNQWIRSRCSFDLQSRTHPRGKPLQFEKSLVRHHSLIICIVYCNPEGPECQLSCNSEKHFSVRLHIEIWAHELQLQLRVFTISKNDRWHCSHCLQPPPPGVALARSAGPRGYSQREYPLE